MHVLLITVMLEFFIIAMTMNEGFRGLAQAQWLLLGVAVVGMSLAAMLLV